MEVFFFESLAAEQKINKKKLNLQNLQKNSRILQKTPKKLQPF